MIKKVFSFTLLLLLTNNTFTKDQNLITSSPDEQSSSSAETTAPTGFLSNIQTIIGKSKTSVKNAIDWVKNKTQNFFACKKIKEPIIPGKISSSSTSTGTEGDIVPGKTYIFVEKESPEDATVDTPAPSKFFASIKEGIKNSVRWVRDSLQTPFDYEKNESTITSGKISSSSFSTGTEGDIVPGKTYISPEDATVDTPAPSKFFANIKEEIKNSVRWIRESLQTPFDYEKNKSTITPEKISSSSSSTSIEIDTDIPVNTSAQSKFFANIKAGIKNSVRWIRESLQTPFDSEKNESTIIPEKISSFSSSSLTGMEKDLIPEKKYVFSKEESHTKESIEEDSSEPPTLLKLSANTKNIVDKSKTDNTSYSTEISLPNKVAITEKPSLPLQFITATRAIANKLKDGTKEAIQRVKDKTQNMFAQKKNADLTPKKPYIFTKALPPNQINQFTQIPKTGDTTTPSTFLANVQAVDEKSKANLKSVDQHAEDEIHTLFAHKKFETNKLEKQLEIPTELTTIEPINISTKNVYKSLKKYAPFSDTNDKEKITEKVFIKNLFMQPARPSKALIAVNKHLSVVTLNYHNAKEMYDLNGVNHNITKLHFGEEPILVKDISLATKLIDEKKLDPIYTKDKDSEYLRIVGNEEITFKGCVESWGTQIDIIKYIWKKNIAVGIHLPFAYKKHSLEAAFSNEDDLFIKYNNFFDDISRQSFSLHYGQDSHKFLKDLFKAKGISELGGSVSGIGDIKLFGQTPVRASSIDQSLAGVCLTIPTAKKASLKKLWGPTLGNGGHLEIETFFSTAISYKEIWNPHIFITFAGATTANAIKRVPKRVKAIIEMKSEEDAICTAKDIMSFGDRVKIKEEEGVGAQKVTVDEFDTTLPNVGDHTACFKLLKGKEFTVHIGNMIKNFIFAKGFLDIFYAFRGKLRDYAYGLDEQNWNLDVYKNNTQQIEHKCGLEFSYQFNEKSRLRFGTTYIFAGRNVEKAYDATLNIHCSF
jgi:hypothetical protein